MPSGNPALAHNTDSQDLYSVRDIFDLGPDGIVVLDEQGLIVDANQSFLNLTEQATLASIVGSSMSDWLGSPGGDGMLLLDSLRLCDHVRQFPTTVKGRLGGSTRAEISAVMKSRDNGGFIVCYVRDIGRRVEATDDAGMLLQFLREMSAQLGHSSLKEIVSTAVGLVERYYIEVALEAVIGNRTAAARMLGMSRQGLYDKLARYGMDTDHNRQ